MPTIRTLSDVVAWRLCLGCGACAFHCKSRHVELVDYLSEGIRPRFLEPDCADCSECLQICPGLGMQASPIDSKAAYDPYFGPILELWEGNAVDPTIRFEGSSGGILTALAAYCVEKEGFHGVLHVGQDPANPFRNITRLSTSRAELIGNAGSRYAPASACDRLDLVENAPSPCVFIGQPSEVSAVRNLRNMRPQLDARLGLVLSFFCAGSPSMQGTIDLIRSHGVEPSEVASIRYRGKGWPGLFTVRRKGRTEPAIEMTYRDSWAAIQAARPLSTHLWPDGGGEDADISCGDPWYSEPKAGDLGSSLVVVRTQRGRDILSRALAAGYLSLRRAERWKLAESQVNLSQKRALIWGRLAALRLLGLPTPRFPGRGLFSNWRRLPLQDKLRSVLGTLRRAIQRRYREPLDLSTCATTAQCLASAPQPGSQHTCSCNAQ